MPSRRAASAGGTTRGALQLAHRGSPSWPAIVATAESRRCAYPRDLLDSEASTVQLAEEVGCALGRCELVERVDDDRSLVPQNGGLGSAHQSSPLRGTMP